MSVDVAWFPDYGRIVDGIFYHLFYIFSGTRGMIDLTTSGTSLEYPHNILWGYSKFTNFGHSALATNF